MVTLSLSEAKMKLSRLVDAVSSRDEEVTITKNGTPAAVLVSPDEFAGWKETLAVQEDRELMAEIRQGLGALAAGEAELYSLEELLP
ncbi:MAG TPA: type II toxin-antitoxin system Phd/YefM family antitoxin [Lentisphaeria bacterium]|jgi:prevent-host-death family protein|nr:type II toxin-antitoxin system Phd/YefM family antitoxin [Lentisphaeria bacterium]